MGGLLMRVRSGLYLTLGYSFSRLGLVSQAVYRTLCLHSNNVDL